MHNKFHILLHFTNKYYENFKNNYAKNSGLKETDD